MCADSDLFGDVIVTIKDVDNWLNHEAKMFGRSQSAREYYAKNYDIANKIKLSKLSGSFYLLMDKFEASIKADSKPIQLYKTQYVADIADELIAVCPNGLHTCLVETCPFYIKRMKHIKSSEAYYARKAKDKRIVKEALNRF